MALSHCIDLNDCSLILGSYEDMEDGQVNAFSILYEGLNPDKDDVIEELSRHAHKDLENIHLVYFNYVNCIHFHRESGAFIEVEHDNELRELS